MTNKLLTEINTEIRLKEEFSTWIGIALEDIPQEILDEAMGGALGMTQMDNMGMGGDSRSEARQGEQEWRAQMQGGKEGPNKSKTYRDPLTGNPEMAKSDAAEPGDFVVVNGKPTKIVDKKEMFGGNEFIYLQGMQKPIIADRLELHKKVGKVKVFALSGK